MSKIPEILRPPVDGLRKRLFSKISPVWKKILYIDLQNDCNCSYETYEKNLDVTSFVLQSDGIKEVIHGWRSVVDICPDISDDKLFDLIRQIQSSPPPPSRIPFVSYVSVDAEVKNFLQAAGIEITKQLEPEYAGVIACNLAGFGAFAFRHSFV